MAEEVRRPSDGDAGPQEDGEARAHLHDVQARLDVLYQAARLFAHDFKNPLSALLLGLQRLTRLAGATEQQPRAHALGSRLEATIHTMNRLVDGLADLARQQAGELQLERTPLPAGEILTRAVEPLRAGAAERQQRLDLELQDGLPEVEWDADRVVRALQHLLARAMQAAPVGGAVRCTAVRSEGEVIVTVEDPGPRPAPQASPSASADEGRPRRSGELAVMVARALAEAHGGRLSIEESLGGGAVIRLALPVLGVPRARGLPHPAGARG